MVLKFNNNINLTKIAKSGQCFRFRKHARGWMYGSSLIRQISRDTIECDIPELFDMMIPYNKIEQAMINHGGYWERCAKIGTGLVILSQPVFETIISFIISQNNSIHRIQKIIQRMCDSTFPTREEMLDWTEERWVELGVGYRARYLKQAVQICDEAWIAELKETPNKIDYLKRLPGVGNKVASCIALFSLQEYNAFPIDVHIQRIIDREFGGVIDLSWCNPYAGIVQQYMFYNEINGGKIMLESMSGMTLCGVIFVNDTPEEVYCDDIGQLAFETCQDGGCWCISEINIGTPLPLTRIDTFASDIKNGHFGTECVGAIYGNDGTVVVLLNDCKAVVRQLWEPLVNIGEPFYYSTDMEYEKED